MFKRSELEILEIVAQGLNVDNYHSTSKLSHGFVTTGDNHLDQPYLYISRLYGYVDDYNSLARRIKEQEKIITALLQYLNLTFREQGSDNPEPKEDILVKVKRKRK